MPTKLTVAALFCLLLSAAALAQGVVSPNTEPSDRTTGAKDAKPSSSSPGAGTVLGRDMSNGATPGRSDLPPTPPHQGQAR